VILTVNRTKLFFDVVGSKLDVSGNVVTIKPTLIALHGGPGFDHVTLRPYFDRFADIAQVVYVDLRGNGRSIGSSPETWTLAQWGDDIKAFCDGLGIERPIVLGQSFGGFVVQSYATRHPSHPAALILASTAARMDLEDRAHRIQQAGGVEARVIAERMWKIADEESIINYMRVVMPLYMTQNEEQSAIAARVTKRLDVTAHFHHAPDGEIYSMDFRKALAQVRCRTLVLSGGPEDLITPPDAAQEIAAAIRPDLARYECFPQCRHGVFRDDPSGTEKIIRSFVAEVVANF
jgi:proline iminopeptidase